MNLTIPNETIGALEFFFKKCRTKVEHCVDIDDAGGICFIKCKGAEFNDKIVLKLLGNKAIAAAFHFVPEIRFLSTRITKVVTDRLRTIHPEIRLIVVSSKESDSDIDRYWQLCKIRGGRWPKAKKPDSETSASGLDRNGLAPKKPGSPTPPQPRTKQKSPIIECHKPLIELVGVYSLRVTDEMVRKETKGRFDRPNLKQKNAMRKELESIVLVEVIVRNPDAKFDVGDFKQPQEGVDPGMWQVAWKEVYPSEDGTSPTASPLQGSRTHVTLRIAFFIHFWQVNVPLGSSYGKIACPPVETLPQRLVDLIDYEGVDG